MIKKHFIALADLIKAKNADSKAEDVASPFNYRTIGLLADFCQAQNSNFNRDRWLGYIAGTNGKNGGKR
jgi:hypothetical protein